MNTTVHNLQTLQSAKVQTVEVLDRLPLKHQVAFLASCCERLAPNYQAFSLVHQYGRNNLVSEVLDVVWDFVNDKDPFLDEAHIRKLSRTLEEIAPRLEDFRSVYVVPAAYTIDALRKAVQFCLNGDIKQARNLVDIMFAVIGDYLNSVAFPFFTMPSPEATKAFNKWVWESPFIIAELEKQQQDLALLESHELLSNSLLEGMRESAKVIGIHFVERGFVIMSPKPFSQTHRILP